jgi:hypothetical protein
VELMMEENLSENGNLEAASGEPEEREERAAPAPQLNRPDPAQTDLQERLEAAERALEALAQQEASGVPQAIQDAAKALSADARIELFRGFKAELAKAAPPSQAPALQLRRPELEPAPPPPSAKAELSFEAELASLWQRPDCTVGMLDKLARKHAMRRN